MSRRGKSIRHDAHDSSGSFSQWYSGWNIDTLTIYHVPTWGGHVIAIVTPNRTLLEVIRGGVQYRRIIERPYKKTGVTRAVNAWLIDLFGFE